MLAARKATVVAKSALNFVVVGAFRSGAAVVQSSLNQVPGVVCHGDLFFAEHGTPEEQDVVRREAHESYFGAELEDACDEKVVPWFRPDYNPCRYLSEQVFPCAKSGESCVGTKLLYDTVGKYELYDLLESMWREGDFCLVHVTRNPVACLVSTKQAQKHGKWSELNSSPVSQRAMPLPVYLEVEELAEVTMRHDAICRKVRSVCKDALEISYRDLVFRFNEVMENVLEFLELGKQPVPTPLTRRMRNRDMKGRISNYTKLKASLRGSMAKFLEDDLF